MFVAEENGSKRNRWKSFGMGIFSKKDREVQSMKKSVVILLALGVVAVGTAGCSPKETSEKTAVKSVDERLISEGVASAVQSSTQALIRERSAIVGGVAASTQSSTQGLIRAKDAVVGGVASAAQSSSQAIALKEGVPESKPVAAE